MNGQGRRGGLVGIIVLLIFGIVFTILGSIFVKIDSSSKEKCTEVVEAEVIDMKMSNTSDSTTYTPVFRYEYNGKTYESHTNTYSSDAYNKFSIGSYVSININPNNPDEIYCAELSAVFGIVGKIFKYIGIGILILAVLSIIIKIIKVIVLGGALGVAAMQTKKFNKQQADFYGQQQWNNMNQGQTIYFDNNGQGQQMQSQQNNIQQQGQGLQGLGNIDFGNRS